MSSLLRKVANYKYYHFCTDLSLDEVVKQEGTSVTSRFIENLMLYALEGINAKERTVRCRLCQLIVACVNSIDELSDNVWEPFKTKMIERLFDKEAAVRVHAVHAMSRLQSLSLTDEIDGLEVLDIFIDLLRHDPSADVRKAVLSQIDVTEKSLIAILERKRDQDIRIRKFFYSSKLSEIDMRTLSIQQRDEVLRTGLMDREPSVKQACIDMIFRNWIHDTNSNLIEFLTCLDVISNTMMSEGALECFFGMNPGLIDSFSLEYMENLTVETSFILRVFTQWKYKAAGGEAIQDLLPELVQMSTYIRTANESFLTTDIDDPARGEIEFILKEILLTCAFLDMSDEVGRRVLSEALLELLTNLEVGEMLFSTALDLLIKQSPSSQELAEILAGLIYDFRDVYQINVSTEDDGLQKSLEALSLGDSIPEDVRILANLRGLELVRALYTQSVSQPEEDLLLADTLTDVVILAVNSPFAAVQSAGLHCLGLACTLSKDLAIEYMPLFFDFVRLGQDDTALIALQTTFDMIFLYGLSTFDDSALDTLSANLYDPRSSVQTVAAEGFAKLLLHGIVGDSGILEGLLHLYYHSSSESEPKLRQCLAYFFPAYCFSHPSHQLNMASIAVKFIETYARSAQGISATEIANQMAHFTDPSLLVNGEYDEIGSHDVMMIDSAWSLIENQGETFKPVLSLISKLRFDDLSKQTIKKAIYLLSQLSKIMTESKPLQTALKKVLSSLVELDDVEVSIDSAELAKVKERLSAHLPISTVAAPVPTAKRSYTKRSSPAEVGHVLDDLADILQ